MTPAADVSQYQGTIDWADMPPIAIIKMSGGDSGLYMDPNAATNYNNAKASGKAVGGYHFIGWTLGASAEATYFMQAMSPLAEYDVYALDIESIPSGVNPVAYVSEMVNLIHSKINVWPLLYMNVSTLNSYDWSSLLANCGLWLADWNNDPAGTIPNVPIYVMQQYNDGPNYDHDEFFGNIDQFKAYGYHAPVATSVPTPAVSTTESTQTTTPESKPLTATVTASSGVTDASTSITSPPVTVSPKQTLDKTNTPTSGTQASTLHTISPIKHTNFTSHISLSSNSSWWSKLWSAILNWFKNF